MKSRTVWSVIALIFAPSVTVLALEPTPKPETGARPITITPAEIKWQKIFPELGDRSAEIAILYTDANTGATQLMIRVPPDFHVPKHWHTANETYTVMRGTFVIEGEGKRQALPAGSFNYVPSKMPHEAWTTPTEGADLFITVDAAWDINWVNGPPKPQDLQGGVSP